MAKCDICGKGAIKARKYSYRGSSQVTKRALRHQKPNTKKVKIIENGTPKTVSVCTRCLRSKKVIRAI